MEPMIFEAMNFMEPIIFNTEMVHAILDGRKTSTRVKVPEKILDKYYSYDDRCNSLMPVGMQSARHYESDYFMEYAPYLIDEILWVRETWKDYFNSETDNLDYCYRADEGKEGITYTDTDDEPIKWRPSIHMPKEAARIFLEVIDVRVERLQDITEDQAIREGFKHGGLAEPWITAIDGFIKVWNSSIKKKELDKFGWNANPWVFVYEFQRFSELLLTEN